MRGNRIAVGPAGALFGLIVLAAAGAMPASGQEATGAIRIVAKSADGIAELGLDCSTLRCSSLGDRQRWTLDEPLVLRDARTGRPIATVHKAAMGIAGSSATLAFIVSAAMAPVNVEITSAAVPVVAFDPMAAFTAGLSLTDIDGTGATVTGNQADGEVFRAILNGASDFATLIATQTAPVPFTSVAADQDFPHPQVFSNLTEAALPLGMVTSIQAQAKFAVTPFDSVAGTARFEIATPNKVAEPGETSRDAGAADRSTPVREQSESEAVASKAITLVDGPRVDLAASVCAGPLATSLQITSGSLMFPAIPGARARASLGVTVTDNNHDGAAIAGLFPDGKLYRTYYNDMGGPATGTVFASLQSALADPKQNTSASSTDQFAAAGAFSTTDQSATPLGMVSSMSASFYFRLNPFDCAAVTSVYVIDGCGDGQAGANEECDDGNNVNGDGCSADCEIEGACCSDGPGTQSACFLTTEDDCNTNAKLYIGDGTVCSPNIDCEALLVTMDSMAAVATPRGVRLTWTTAMEIDTIGFRVLREDLAQRREKLLAVVADLIPAAGSGLIGATYELFDDSPAAARAMHYYIEDIDINGRVTRHGPIVVERGTRQSTGGRRAPGP